MANFLSMLPYCIARYNYMTYQSIYIALVKRDYKCNYGCTYGRKSKKLQPLFFRTKWLKAQKVTMKTTSDFNFDLNPAVYQHRSPEKLSIKKGLQRRFQI